MLCQHWRYFVFLCRHKWYVFVAGLRVGVSVWRLLIHDWSKFTPLEWRQYVRKHTGIHDGAVWAAVLWHQHRNPHHWQFWILNEDHGPTFVLPMPEHYAREMVADWMGAERARKGGWDVRDWYAKNRDVIRLHPETRAFVENLLHLAERPHGHAVDAHE